MTHRIICAVFATFAAICTRNCAAADGSIVDFVRDMPPLIGLFMFLAYLAFITHRNDTRSNKKRTRSDDEMEGDG